MIFSRQNILLVIKIHWANDARSMTENMEGNSNSIAGLTTFSCCYIQMRDSFLEERMPSIRILEPYSEVQLFWI